MAYSSVTAGFQVGSYALIAFQSDLPKMVFDRRYLKKYSLPFQECLTLSDA